MIVRAINQKGDNKKKLIGEGKFDLSPYLSHFKVETEAELDLKSKRGNVGTLHLYIDWQPHESDEVAESFPAPEFD